MGSRQVGCPYDRSQVVGIFDIVQKKDKGIFPFLPGNLQNVLHLRVGKSRRVGDDPWCLPVSDIWSRRSFDTKFMMVSCFFASRIIVRTGPSMQPSST